MALGDGSMAGHLRSYLLSPTFANVEGMTPQDVDRRRALSEALLSSGTSNEPVTSVFGGINKMLQAYLGGKGIWRAENTDIAIRDREEAEAAAERARLEQQQLAGLNTMINFGWPEQTGTASGPVMTPGTPGFDGGTAMRAARATADAPPPPSGQQQVPASQQEFIDMMMPYAMEASQRTGIDPRIIIAQSAQETGWGQHAPGNNYFGIKSHGQAGGNSLSTTEYVNGAPVTINDSFRAYGSPAESVAGYADFMLQNGRYEPMRTAQGLDAQLAALAQSGYATDPGYANSVGQIARGINVPQSPSAETPAADPTRAFVEALVANPATRDDAIPIIMAQITRLTTPVAPADPITVAQNTDVITPDGRLIYSNRPEPEPASPGFRLATPQEREAAGYGPNDPPLQVGPDNRMYELGGGQTINVGGQEGAMDAALGRVLGTDVFGAMITEGAQAQQDYALIDRLGTLLGQTGGGVLPALSQVAGNFGIDLAGITDETQAAQAIISYLTPRQRVPGAGATSDFDARMFAASLPRLINQPGANEIILNTMRGMAQHKMALGDIAMRVALPEGDPQRLTTAQAFEAMRALPDPFAAFKASGLAEPIAPAAAPATGAALPGTGTTMEQRLTPQTAPAAIPPPPAGIDPAEWPALWQNMTPADRALFQ